MKKENKRIVAKKIINDINRREMINKKTEFAAKNEIKTVFESLNSSELGLSENEVSKSKSLNGINKITQGKQKTLFEKIVAAFVNPFTAILFCLALVSSVTDMIMPYYEIFGNTKEDFSCITVVIIVVMVLISGILRFIQEARSGNAAEKLLSMITTT